MTRRGTASATAVALAVALLGIGVGGASDGDPLLRYQWNLRQIGVPAAWSRAQGAGVLVAVIDTGIDPTHPDLIGAVTVPRDANFACWEVDQRRSQYYTSTESSSCGKPATDDHGHGTFIAGIIAARRGNGEGGASVAPEAKLLSVKVADSRGVSNVPAVARAIRYATRQGARVINLSLGFEGADTAADAVEDHAGPIVPRTNRPVPVLFTGVWADPLRKLDRAIDYAWAHGAVIVAGAANESLPFCRTPAMVEHALCVGAQLPEGVNATYSNFGYELDLVAPAGDWPYDTCSQPDDPGPGGVIGQLEYTRLVVSTWPTGLTACEGTRGPYEIGGGTSYAAPHVSGVAALLASLGLNNREIVRCLTQTADDLGPPGYDLVFGHGRVNASRAVAEC